MVLPKEINQKIVIAAILVSFGLIVGSIYLHIQQKHHFGRLNIGDNRVQPTVGVENLPKDDVIYVPPLQSSSSSPSSSPSNSVIDKTRQIIQNIEDDYSSATSKEYANDEAYDGTENAADTADNVNANVETLNMALGNTKSTESYVMDNDYHSTDNDVSYEYSDSKENVRTSMEQEQQQEEDKHGLTKDCLRCLCKTINDCKPVKCPTVGPCGIYSIYKSYWLDGGEQTTMDNGTDYSEVDEEDRDYVRCINNEKCATDTVKSYIKRYQKDCNSDGIIDCQDHIALHVLGPSGCQTKELTMIHRFRMKSCLK